ncbi:hypothetical protein ADIARSV_3099 [Arcticibacter svalbardensis MN12-7]|uniref:Uncharacterized protein n=1 Tax=Arcticibacter svalbardensis MN12-7 TaxID=1150600 RepID=R9GXS4_9SPHI|nr:hypothetical protein ADIARSV_3099 [Arcticibacter svalbardensis MN12-7]
MLNGIKFDYNYESMFHNLYSKELLAGISLNGLKSKWELIISKSLSFVK